MSGARYPSVPAPALQGGGARYGQTFGNGNKTFPTGQDLTDQRIQYFGPMPRDYTNDPYHDYDTENRTMPELWRQSASAYITKLIIKRIDSTEDIFTREILPWGVYDGGNQVRVEQIVFNPHLLDEQPEQTVPRVITQTYESWTQNLPRMAIGFQMEDGFAMSSKGIRDYGYHQVQMSNAVVMSAQLKCIYALMENKGAESWWEAYGVPYNRRALRNLFEYETRMWGILSKKRGYQLMIKMARNIFADRNVVPDTLLLPQGAVDDYRVQHLPETTYQNQGPTGLARSEGQGEIPSQTPGGMKVVEVPRYPMDEHNQPEDVFARLRTIGEFFQRTHAHHMECSPEDYRTALLSYTALDSNTDQMSITPFREHLENSPLFLPEGKLSPQCGRPFFLAKAGNTRTVDEYLKNVKVDKKFYATLKIAHRDNRSGNFRNNDKGSFLDTFDPKNWDQDKRAHGAPQKWETLAFDDGHDDMDMDAFEDPFDRLSRNRNQKKDQTKDPQKIRDAVHRVMATSQSTLRPRGRAATSVRHGPSAESLYEEAHAISNEKERQAILKKQNHRLYPFVLVDEIVNGRRPIGELESRFPRFNGKTQQCILDLGRMVGSDDLDEYQQAFVDFTRTASVSNPTTDSVHNFSASRAASAFLASVGSEETVNLVDDVAPSGAPEQTQRTHHIVALALAALEELGVSLPRQFTETVAKSQLVAALNETERFNQEPVEVVAEAVARVLGNYVSDASGLLKLRDDELAEAIANELDGKSADKGGWRYKILDQQKYEEFFAEMPVTALTRDHFLFFCDHDIWMPIAGLDFRPHIEYEMSSAIMLKRGAETGQCLKNFVNFQLSHDGQRKMLFGHLSLYLGAIIYENRNILNLPNVIARAYIQGGALRYFKPFEEDDLRIYQSGKFTGFRSMFAIPLYPDEVVNRSNMDITGMFPEDLQAFDHDNEPGKFHYSSAPYMIHVWPWKFGPQQTYIQNHFDRRLGSVNTRVFQGHQKIPICKGAVIEMQGGEVFGSGHWPCSYAGVVADRCGYGKNGYNLDELDLRAGSSSVSLSSLMTTVIRA